MEENLHNCPRIIYLVQRFAYSRDKMTEHIENTADFRYFQNGGAGVEPTLTGLSKNFKDPEVFCRVKHNQISSFP